MRDHGERDARADEAGLTTEDIAHPQAGAPAATTREDERQQVPVYPGEATADPRDTAAGVRETDPGRRDAAEGIRETDPGTREADDGTGAPGRAPTEQWDGEPGRATTERGAVDAPAADEEPLLGAPDAEGYRKAWSEIQGRFVDDPQEAVRSADALVAEVMQTLARTFSARKQGLEGQWGQGGQVATEELRLALQQYRSFFNRLLNT
ncbi:hypothetical protein OG590_31595 [Streptomyces goshikiensis]|uniref:hypothetical protein n=1 Tax=Streptomyces TaxID=1883 RepID=UPI000F55536C|nr:MULTISPECIES: hypothetical protein [Streptomyces]RPK39962.1 hypothetical protein EES37_21015 [Streptomyces sp. ADI91-18]WBY18783.1 hypothetical protein PET44_03615 [Streptomyces goshikiensis]WSR97478.1 hypothetical protein OG224_05080 [Streptomyces goshikiensis]WSY01395.1 hypothetical protein OG590_31595 [Streptomyces goshikiensis]